MNIRNFNEDDICDIYPNRICDNCGDCLKEEGIDVRAIKIEDIAKNVEENAFLEEEYKKMLALLKEEGSLDKLENDTFDELKGEESQEYIDAFDHIEYIDDLELLDEENFDEATEEIFPGVRKLKTKY
ncbi:hypothetical protein E5347_04900 [Clostridium sartagoforme]|uniref:Uncharacterized protein n=1 Tax=Clostridium sartagoforme TaxID=84031 RepID=A0A4S2DP24_9CLOT|nr:hypothetical protein [Clostridium sartagoforme]TGY44157.1 hypothetical protein E5347_04900 [Clostridium sartagoforme]